MTIREAFLEGKALLAAARIETPSLDAALLLAEALHTDRAALIVRGAETIAGEERDAFFGLIRRRGAGECTAYILGRKEFWGLEFTVTPDVLVPRPDTETLVEAALARAGKERSPRVLDLCTGSGAVAVALKRELPGAEIWASDLSAKALDIARANAGRILGSPEAVRFVRSDLLGAFGGVPEAPGVRFSLIVANPPYVKRGDIGALAREVRGEPRMALDGGEDGLELIRRLIPQAAGRLLKGGGLLIEADPGQMEAVEAILAEKGFGRPERCRDLAGRERVIGAAFYG